MKKLVFIVSLSILCGPIWAQITRIQHFNAHSGDKAAQTLFTLFNQTFGLPVLYDYQSFGSFSSGGLWLGNITFEFVGHQDGDNLKAIFKGVALEPKQHTEAIVKMLDEKQIVHDAPDVAMMNVNGGQVPFYTVIGLKDLSAEGKRIFVCDYANRVFINTFSIKADSLLKANKGGPLGVIGLKKIIIGTTDKAKEVVVWGNVPGVIRKNDHFFSFSEGPDILIEPAGTDCVKEIVVKVKSLEQAMAFLEQRQCLKREGAKLLIDPEKLHGLRVILEN